MITKQCIREGCEIVFQYKDNTKIYCSRSCAAKVNNRLYPKRKPGAPKPKRKSAVERWLDGEYDGNTKFGLSQPIRKYLLEQANYTCQDGRSGCHGWSGFNPISGKSCLTVDHIDGDSTNQKIDNLIVMCPNCHSMTPTYGALNKGKGRKHRYAAVA